MLTLILKTMTHYMGTLSHSWEHLLSYQGSPFIESLVQQTSSECVCLYIQLKIIVQSLSHVQFFWDLINCSPSDASILGTSQVKMLDWIATSLSRDLPNPRIEPESLASPALQADSLPLSHWGSTTVNNVYLYIYVLFMY